MIKFRKMHFCNCSISWFFYFNSLPMVCGLFFILQFSINFMYSWWLSDIFLNFLVTFFTEYSSNNPLKQNFLIAQLNEKCPFNSHLFLSHRSPLFCHNLLVEIRISIDHYFLIFQAKWTSQNFNNHSKKV